MLRNLSISTFVLVLVTQLLLLVVVDATTFNHLDHFEPSVDIDDDLDDYHNYDFDRDVMFGSHDTEQFKSLNADESKKKLVQLFNKIDSNKDGFINRTELINWAIKSLANFDLEAVEPMFKEYDVNEDMYVSWNEYTTKVYGYSEAEITKMKNGELSDNKLFLESLDDEKFKFDLADQDNNQLLNLSEMAAFKYPHNYFHMGPAEIRYTLKHIDFNNDGFIDRKEFVSEDALDTLTDKTKLMEENEFRKYDTNQDGKLDSEEMLPWVAPGFNKTAEDETDHLFLQSDVDKDGVLSEKEVVEQHKFWVGSQITDYGHHLEKDEL